MKNVEQYLCHFVYRAFGVCISSDTGCQLYRNIFAQQNPNTVREYSTTLCPISILKKHIPFCCVLSVRDVPDNERVKSIVYSYAKELCGKSCVAGKLEDRRRNTTKAK